MTRYVALLRGIAPTNPKMRNAELVQVFEGVGLDDVTTVISSGNVLFTSPERSARRLEDRLEAALRDHLGAPCAAIVRSRAQIERLAASDVFDRFDDGPTERCQVSFLKRAPNRHPELPVVEGTEVVAVADGALLWVIDTTSSTTPRMMAAIERAYDKQVTTRTWRTVHRIATALGPGR